MNPDDSLPDDTRCESCGKALPGDAAGHPEEWAYQGYCDAKCGLRDSVRWLTKKAVEDGWGLGGPTDITSRAMDELFPRTPIRIEVTRQRHGYSAYVGGLSPHAAWGDTSQEAVGHLVQNHPEVFGIDLSVREVH